MSPEHYFEMQGCLTPDQSAAGYTVSGHYFYDETWAFVCGPFKTRDDCLKECCRYARWLEKGRAG